MTKCYQTSFQFASVKRRKVEVDFTGGNISSNAGVMLLSKVDERLNLSKRVAKSLVDSRRAASCDHSTQELIRQRILALALGYEDLNDHQTLRDDLILQTAVARDKPLASPSTLCRFEQKTNRDSAIAVHQVYFDQFIKSYEKAPRQIILDFDATDTPLHGDQEGRFFHGYYDHYCYLPLYVFCERHLLVSYLRPSNIDPAKHSWAILSLLVRAIRSKWPKTRIIFRGDSGFCRWKLLRWCDRNDVKYIVGIAKNDRLTDQARFWINMAETCHKQFNTKQRLFSEFYYAAKTWDRKRRILLKAEHNSLGSNPRFVVTNLEQSPQYLYEKIYCMRGDMENRIKDQQLGLFAHRASSHSWWSNQWRQLLSGLAYILLEGLRRLGLQKTELQNASPNTIRVKLLKIGAVVIRNSRRVRIMMSSSFPMKDLFFSICTRINTS